MWYHDRVGDRERGYRYGPGQIQQLQNLMAQGVDAILVNPGDVNGLNATLGRGSCTGDHRDLGGPGAECALRVERAH